MFCTLTLSLSPLSPYLSLFFSTSSPSFNLTSKISPDSIFIRPWNQCWGKTCFKTLYLSLSPLSPYLPLPSFSFSRSLLPKFLRTTSPSGLGIDVEVGHVLYSHSLTLSPLSPTLLFLPLLILTSKISPDSIFIRPWNHCWGKTFCTLSPLSFSLPLSSFSLSTSISLSLSLSLSVSLSPLALSLSLNFQNFSAQHLHPALESMLR